MNETTNGACDGNVIEKLLVLQEHDVQIRDMEKEMRDIPARKKEEMGRLDEHKAVFAKLQGNLKARQADTKKIELEAESVREKIAKLRQQQLEIKTNKEFRVIEVEIKGLEAEIFKLEDQELLVMEAIEGIRRELGAKTNDLKEEETAVRRDVQALDERSAVLENEMKRVKAAREDAAKGIAREWLARYETVFARRDRALAPIENGVCGGCHMTLPPYLAHNARGREAMVSCSYCGRLIYM